MSPDRQMRKAFEAVQAWRRLHNGSYPGRLVDLRTSGLLPSEGAICTELLGEHSGSDAPRTENLRAAGRKAIPRERGDKMSDRVLRASIDRMYLPRPPLNTRGSR